MPGCRLVLVHFGGVPINLHRWLVSNKLLLTLDVIIIYSMHPSNHYGLASGLFLGFSGQRFMRGANVGHELCFHFTIQQRFYHVN